MPQLLRPNAQSSYARSFAGGCHSFTTYPSSMKFAHTNHVSITYRCLQRPSPLPSRCRPSRHLHLPRHFCQVDRNRRRVILQVQLRAEHLSSGFLHATQSDVKPSSLAVSPAPFFSHSSTTTMNELRAGWRAKPSIAPTAISKHPCWASRT